MFYFYKVLKTTAKGLQIYYGAKEAKPLLHRRGVWCPIPCLFMIPALLHFSCIFDGWKVLMIYYYLKSEDCRYGIHIHRSDIHLKPFPGKHVKLEVSVCLCLV